MSLACRRNTYLWRHPTNNSPTVLNRSSEVVKRHQIFNSVQMIECSFDLCATQRHPVETKCCQYPPLQFVFEQKFVHHGPITIAIDCNGLSLLIFEENWPNYDSGPKSIPNSDSFWVRRLFNVCVRVLCAPNATILFVYIPAQIKMSFIWKDEFFLPKSASSVSL